MKTYATVKDGKVTEITRTESPTDDMVECNKPVFIRGKRYAGTMPKVGYSWDGEKFNHEG